MKVFLGGRTMHFSIGGFQILAGTNADGRANGQKYDFCHMVTLLPGSTNNIMCSVGLEKTQFECSQLVQVVVPSWYCSSSSYHSPGFVLMYSLYSSYST